MRERLGNDSGIVPGTSRAITFDGKAGVILSPNTALVSDPIDLPVPALASLAVSTYVSHATAPTTFHAIGRQTAYLAAGDQTAASVLFPSSRKTQSRYLLSGVETFEPRGGTTIVTLGDSIIDGTHSTQDANRRWPDILAERLQRAGRREQAVANAGIAGNRMLQNGTGPKALSRLDRDVLSRPGLRFVTVLEGI